MLILSSQKSTRNMQEIIDELSKIWHGSWSQAVLKIIDDLVGFPGSSAGEESTCNTGDPGWIAESGSSPEERVGYPLQYSWASLVRRKESTCNVGDLGSYPGLGRSLGEGNGNPLKYFFLENPHGRAIWWATVHGVTKELDTTDRLSTAQGKINSHSQLNPRVTKSPK